LAATAHKAARCPLPFQRRNSGKFPSEGFVSRARHSMSFQLEGRCPATSNIIPKYCLERCYFRFLWIKGSIAVSLATPYPSVATGGIVRINDRRRMRGNTMSEAGVWRRRGLCRLVMPEGSLRSGLSMAWSMFDGVRMVIVLFHTSCGWGDCGELCLVVW
jgi:hypothetical protein